MANSNDFNQNRTFGIEMEIIANQGMTREDVARAIRGNGITINVEGYNHNTRPDWKIVTDASLQGNGMEIVSPILKGDDGINQLKIVCQSLEGIATVNMSCGLHVHHDVQDFDLTNFKNMFKLWVKYETALDSIMPASRRGNARWCKNNKTNTDLKAMFNHIDAATSVARLYSNAQYSDRYYKLNMASYFRQGTLEFRHHSGSVEFVKIVNWLILTQAMVESVITNKTIAVTGEGKLENILKKTNNRQVKQFYRARVQQFNARRAA